MLPLARFWTILGGAYLPAAGSWGFFVYNGPHRGMLISAGYLGLGVTLAVGTLLASTLALYVLKARRAHAPIIAPPNTFFEDPDNRSRLLSWSTVAAFGLMILAGIACFGNRYADSRIYLWDSTAPLSDSFIGSRAEAQAKGCPKGPCFAMGQRMEGAGRAEHVAEYIPYLSDGLLIVLAIAQLGALSFLGCAAWRPQQPLTYEL
ncbi:hypothetical protein J4G43_026715 [Bradyrhizobium barranii subsp. barranii]|uniref:Uncharacterized protein n=1 Tax=Bradyrhizobium barranii subsp. barranii TaxID=2823807 RepID=A0A939M7Y8_9BRAD|nr:hypothetical protein [Bradyrhizobium barranii]UEM08396.1 hypothetical protein J4G43_026715 [Bradyrhizobium barranii subsp. barranii]